MLCWLNVCLSRLSLSFLSQQGYCWFTMDFTFELFLIGHVQPYTLMLWVSTKTRIICSQWVSLHLLALLTNPFFDSFQLHIYDDHIHTRGGLMYYWENSVLVLGPFQNFCTSAGPGIGSKADLWLVGDP